MNVASAVQPTRDEQNTDWWRGAVIYQIYPRSFQDSNGDGIGDLLGIAQRLPHVASLGVDAVWISPFFTSPMKDFGYDVSDYCDVDPMFGSLADFDILISTAHRLGLKVFIDLVLSHTSEEHPWFKLSRTSRDNEKANWYVWADPKPDGTPPNNWLSIFGGPAWQWDGTRMQYYMHNFLTEQPDLNFHEPKVQEALLNIARFWLGRGVDGFRLDTINFYVHDAQLRDNPPLDPAERNPITAPAVNPYTWQDHLYDKTQPENLLFLQKLRALLNEYNAAAVGRGRRGPARARGAGRIHRRRRQDPDELRLRASLRGMSERQVHRDRLRQGRGRRGAGLGMLGLFQSRRAASPHALEALGRRRPLLQLPDDVPARVVLHLSGRGTGALRSGHRVRRPAGSIRDQVLAVVQGPRRMPHADGLGTVEPERRVFVGHAVAAGQPRASQPRRVARRNRIRRRSCTITAGRSPSATPTRRSEKARRRKWRPMATSCGSNAASGIRRFSAPSTCRASPG